MLMRRRAPAPIRTGMRGRRRAGGERDEQPVPVARGAGRVEPRVGAPEVAATSWLGTPGATEQETLALEWRLPINRPSCHRQFLTITQVWWQVAGYAEPYCVQPTLVLADSSRPTRSTGTWLATGTGSTPGWRDALPGSDASLCPG